MYPVPPQFGQLSGSTPLPLSVAIIVHDVESKFAADRLALRITNKNRRKAKGRQMFALFSSSRKLRSNLARHGVGETTAGAK